MTFVQCVDKAKELQIYYESIGVTPAKALYLSSGFAVALYRGDQDIIINEVLREANHGQPKE